MSRPKGTCPGCRLLVAECLCDEEDDKGMTTADPDKPCPHEDFEVWAEVNRLSSTEGGPVDAYTADIKINCASCGEPFRWIGLEAGLMPSRPMVSVDETQLRAPIRPASSDPDFGLGIPGFAVRMRLPRLPGGCWWGSRSRPGPRSACTPARVTPGSDTTGVKAPLACRGSIVVVRAAGASCGLDPPAGGEAGPRQPPGQAPPLTASEVDRTRT